MVKEWVLLLLFSSSLLLFLFSFSLLVFATSSSCFFSLVSLFLFPFLFLFSPILAFFLLSLFPPSFSFSLSISSSVSSLSFSSILLVPSLLISLFPSPVHPLSLCFYLLFPLSISLSYSFALYLSSDHLANIMRFSICGLVSLHVKSCPWLCDFQKGCNCVFNNLYLNYFNFAALKIVVSRQPSLLR